MLSVCMRRGYQLDAVDRVLPVLFGAPRHGMRLPGVRGRRRAAPFFVQHRSSRPMTRTEMPLSTMRAAIRGHDLLRHPFYQAWSAGTLAEGALATYAREYGAFIRALDCGWSTLD